MSGGLRVIACPKCRSINCQRGISSPNEVQFMCMDCGHMFLLVRTSQQGVEAGLKNEKEDDSSGNT